MKFLCDRCKTRYAIADDRVRGKILKIRCKNCSAVITVREGMDEGAAGEASRAEPAPARPGTATTAPPPPMSTTPSAPPPPPPPAALDEEWYVSKDGDQEGPFTLTEAQAWIAARTGDEDLHCWNEGFDDWLPVEKVSHFRGLRGAPRSRPATQQGSAVEREPEPKPLFAATLAAVEAEAAAAAPPPKPAPAPAPMASEIPPSKQPAAAPWRVPTPASGQPASPPLPKAGTPAVGVPSLPKAGTPAVGVPSLPKRGTPPAGVPKAPAPVASAPAPTVAEPTARPPLPTPFGATPRAPTGASAVVPAPTPPAPAPMPPAPTPAPTPPAPAPIVAAPPPRPVAAARFDHGVDDDGPELVDDEPPPRGPQAVTPAAAMPPDDDLDIGEVSRVVRLADLMGPRDAPPPAAAAPVRPVAKPRAPTAAFAAVGRSTGAVEAFSAAPTPSFDLGSSADLAPPPPPPRRRGPGLYIGLGLGAVALAVVAVILLSSSSEDTSGNATTGGTDDFSNLGYRPNDPTRPSGGTGPGTTVDVGSGTAKPVGSGTVRRPTGSGTGTNPNGSGTGSGTGTGKVEPTGTNPGLRELSPDDVFTMSARMEVGTRRCYERAMKADPFLKVSKIKATISVSAAGPVTDVRLSDKSDHPLGQCLIAAIKRWPFAASKDGIVSEFALVFEQK